MSFPLSAALYLEQSFVYSFSSMSVKILLPFATPDTIIIYCVTILLLAHNSPQVMILSRVSDIVMQLFYTVTVNAAMVLVKISNDQYLNLVNLLAVYFFVTAMGENRSSVMAQYILVIQLSTSLNAIQDRMLSQSVVAVLIIIATLFHNENVVSEISQLLLIEYIFHYIEQAVPMDMVLPISIIILYFAYPFFEYYPKLSRLYRYAIFAVANDTDMKRIPAWTSLVILWMIWLSSIDAVSSDLACNLGSQLSVSFILKSIHIAFQNDPMIVVFCCLISFKILSAIWIKQSS